MSLQHDFLRHALPGVRVQSSSICLYVDRKFDTIGEIVTECDRLFHSIISRKTTSELDFSNLSEEDQLELARIAYFLFKEATAHVISKLGISRAVERGFPILKVLFAQKNPSKKAFDLITSVRGAHALMIAYVLDAVDSEVASDFGKKFLKQEGEFARGSGIPTSFLTLASLSASVEKESLHQVLGDLFLSNRESLLTLNGELHDLQGDREQLRFEKALGEVIRFFTQCSVLDNFKEPEFPIFCAEISALLTPKQNGVLSGLMEIEKAFDELNVPVALALIQKIPPPVLVGDVAMQIRDALSKANYASQLITSADVSAACRYYEEGLCPFTVKEQVSLPGVEIGNVTGAINVSRFPLLIVLGVLCILGTLILLLKRKVKSHVRSSGDIEILEEVSEPNGVSEEDGGILENGSLSSSDRDKLRQLRREFDLTPYDGVKELHVAYRKKVVESHPDTKKDGGTAFVELQAKYLKAKRFLERLEKTQPKRNSEDWSID